MDLNPLVSIIVPTRNSSRTLEACLKSIKDQTYNAIELIVVDNNSTDTTKEIGRKYTDKVFNFGPERTFQRNFGAKQASGAYLLMLDSDMVLSPSLVAEGVERFEKEKEIGSLKITEESFGEGFWTKCKKLERSLYIGIDWMNGSRFFRKEVFEQAGGYTTESYNCEDWDLSQRAERVAASATMKSYIYHDEGRIYFFKNLKDKFYDTKDFGLYKDRETNRELAKKQMSFLKRFGIFLSRRKKLFANPMLGVAMLFMKVFEFIFAGFGYVFGRLEKRFNKQ